MRIPENEVGLPLVEAVHAVHGRRPNLCTVIRWSKSRNRFGNRLESWLQGGRRVTSVEAVRRYDERNTAASDAEHGVAASTSAQQSRAQAQAIRELDREFGSPSDKHPSSDACVGTKLHIGSSNKGQES